MYYINKYDYKVKKNKILQSLQGSQSFTNLSEALNALFIYVVDYIGTQDGFEKAQDDKIMQFMFNKKKFRTALRASLNPGHYIIRDPDDHVYKLEVWQKSIERLGSGWIYGEYTKEVWKKVFDVDIIEVNICTKEEVELK